MAWIELHQSVFTHRKTLALADILGLSEVYAAGHVTALWCWSLDNAPEGMLPASRRVIARAAYWPGDPDAFVEALLEVGYLDQEGDKLYIHDWESYAGRLIGQRRANAEKQRAWRDRQQQSRNDNSNDNSNGDITVTLPLRNGATVPYPTQPNSTEPTRVTRARLDTMFEELWAALPARNGRKAGPKASVKVAFAKIPEHEWSAVVEAARNYADWCSDADEFAVDPIRFVKGDKWQDYRQPIKVTPKGANNGQPTSNKAAAAALRNFQRAGATLGFMDEPDKRLLPDKNADPPGRY